jgi:glucosylceramidase
LLLVAVTVMTACLSLSPAATALPAPTNVPVRVYLTDANPAHAGLTAEPELEFSRARANRSLRWLDVDDRLHYQRILGFGAAITDSSAWLIGTQLTTGERQRVLRALFSPGKGIGLNFMRVAIGASDFTATGEPYSYDDEGVDPTLANFSIAHDKPYVIPVLKAMMSRDHRIDLFASEWSPPAWMKANDNLDNLFGKGTLLPLYYGAFADYLVKFIQAYRSDGLPIWGIAPQNEPGNDSSYPGMSLTAADEADIIENDLAPLLAGAGLHTRIYAGETDDSSALPATVLNSPARRLISGAAWHCYGGEDRISVFHRRFPGAENLLSECAPEISPYAPAEAVIDAMRNWASAFDLWNTALDQDGGPVEEPDAGCPNCMGLVTINDGAEPLGDKPAPRFTSSFYQLGQFSKFVQRGAVRVSTPRWVHDKGPRSRPAVSPGVDNVAFVNPNGTRVLVAFNNSDRSYRFGVEWHSLRFEYTLRGGATVTFVWHAAPPTKASSCLNAGVAYYINNLKPIRSYARPEC